MEFSKISKNILCTLTLNITPFNSHSHGTRIDMLFNLTFAQTMGCIIRADNLVIRRIILQENFAFMYFSERDYGLRDYRHLFAFHDVSLKSGPRYTMKLVVRTADNIIVIAIHLLTL